MDEALRPGKYTQSDVDYRKPLDYPLALTENGARAKPRTLGLERTERIRIPLSKLKETTAELSAEESFPLAAPDTRSRSYRLVNIDFD